jgi:hypothetical protein
MATRTPGLQSRSQYHAYWGIYSDGSTGLPNQSGNPLSSPGELDKLEAGDTAYSGEVGNAGLYVCTDPGGDSATPAATWVMLASGGAVTQTIRDAHQIVVGQNTAAPFSDVVGVDADFVDSGDGAQLQAALSSAAALITGSRRAVDVRLRPCNITVPVATPSLSMAADIKLVGADRNACILSRAEGTILTVQGIANAIEGITFSFLNDGGIGDQGLLLASGTLGSVSGLEVRQCRFTYSNSDGNPVVNTRNGIYIDNSPASSVIVEQNEFDLASCINADQDRVGCALNIVQVSQSSSGTIRFEENDISFGNMFLANVNAASEAANPIVIRGNVHAQAGATAATGVIKLIFDGTVPVAGEGVFRGPEIVDNVVSMVTSTFVAGFNPPQIVEVRVESTDERGLEAVKIVGNTLASTVSTGTNTAILLENASDQTSRVSAVAIGGNVLDVAAQGSGGSTIVIQQSSGNYQESFSFQSVAVSGNVVRSQATALSASKSAAAGFGAIRKVTFTGNSCAGVFSNPMVVSNSVDNVDFAIVGNTLDGFIGEATDPSATFEVAHNV